MWWSCSGIAEGCGGTRVVVAAGGGTNVANTAGVTPHTLCATADGACTSSASPDYTPEPLLHTRAVPALPHSTAPAPPAARAHTEPSFSAATASTRQHCSECCTCSTAWRCAFHPTPSTSLPQTCECAVVVAAWAGGGIAGAQLTSGAADVLPLLQIRPRCLGVSNTRRPGLLPHSHRQGARQEVWLCNGRSNQHAGVGNRRCSAWRRTRQAPSTFDPPRPTTLLRCTGGAGGAVHTNQHRRPRVAPGEG
jgi:hypothetical protein